MFQKIMNQKSLIIISLSVIFLSACSNTAINNEDNIKLNMNQNTSTINSPSPQPSTASAQVTSAPITQTTPQNEAYVGIKTKDGEIVLKLYQKEAPNTVSNFIKKSDSGYYNGLNFHRVIAGFMAQGGDPTGTGTGGGDQKSELNNIGFKRGSIGLARTPVSKDISNDSQFFICFTTEQCQQLTGDYVNFGEVVSGLDVLDKIVQGDKIIIMSSKTK